MPIRRFMSIPGQQCKVTVEVEKIGLKNLQKNIEKSQFIPLPKIKWKRQYTLSERIVQSAWWWNLTFKNDAKRTDMSSK